LEQVNDISKELTNVTFSTALIPYLSSRVSRVAQQRKEPETCVFWLPATRAFWGAHWWTACSPMAGLAVERRPWKNWSSSRAGRTVCPTTLACASFGAISVPVWFGILFCVNMQVSFLSPPFGPAAFCLKSVAPPEITLPDIFRGFMPFMSIQFLVLMLILFFPELTTFFR
ncbi:MAG: TRAP transporter large permease subunit, partial [Salaquimonas sp.]|nr:TRAP transporter large permease subunit [Salaquimonas sp.]